MMGGFPRPRRPRGPGGPAFLFPLVLVGGFVLLRHFGTSRSGMGRAPWIALVFLAVVLVGGALWTYIARLRSERGARPKNVFDRTLVQIARDHGGRITPAEVVEKTDLTLEGARRKLEDYAKAGNLDLEYDESGNIYYRMPGEFGGG